MSEDKKLNENIESEEIKTEDSKLDSKDSSSEASLTKTAEELGAMNVDELMEQYDLETIW